MRRNIIPSQLWSILLIVGGVFLLLHNLHYIYIGSVWKFFPIIFIIIGIERSLGSSSTNQSISAFWWIFMGTWLLMNLNKFLGFTFKTTWPLIIIASGAVLLWRNMKRS